jgi:hypothetical protein
VVVVAGCDVVVAAPPPPLLLEAAVVVVPPLWLGRVLLGGTVTAPGPSVEGVVVSGDPAVAWVLKVVDVVEPVLEAVGFEEPQAARSSSNGTSAR